MSAGKYIVAAAIVGLVALALPVPVLSQGTVPSGVRDNPEDSEFQFSGIFIQTLPHSALNTLPGFGLGSFLQGQAHTGRNLALADTLAWGLLVPGTIMSLRGLEDGASGEEEASIGDLLLLAGFGVYAGSRILGLTAPFFAAFKQEQDPQRLMAPVFYNIVPGFGLGSRLQGDMKSARLLRILDLAALGALGALSGFALNGDEIPTAASAIVFLGLFSTSKIGGVILPYRYRDARVRD